MSPSARLFGFATVLSGALFFSNAAFAQDLQDKVQFGLDVGLLSFNKSTLDLDDSDVEIESDGFAVGTLPSAALRAGYAITPNVVVGAFFQVSYKQIEINDVDTDTVEFAVGPSIEYIFGAGQIRPFVGAALALTYLQNDSGLENDQLLFGGRMAGGMHLFLAESVSLDPSVGFSFGIGSGSTEANNGNDVDFGVTAWGIDAKLGLSAWF